MSGLGVVAESATKPGATSPPGNQSYDHKNTTESPGEIVLSALSVILTLASLVVMVYIGKKTLEIMRSTQENGEDGRSDIEQGPALRPDEPLVDASNTESDPESSTPHQINHIFLGLQAITSGALRAVISSLPKAIFHRQEGLTDESEVERLTSSSESQ